MLNEIPMPLNFLLLPICLAGLIAYCRMILDIHHEDSAFIDKITLLLIAVPIFICIIVVTFAIFLNVLGLIIELFI